jgi:hypothetical protein
VITGISRRLAVASLLAWALPLPAQEEKPVPRRLTQEEKEDFLRTAEVKGYRTLDRGVTLSLRLTLEKNGFRHDAHFQKIDQSKSRFESKDGSELNFKDTWKFNVAAYELAKLLGIDDMIPPSIERKYGGDTGAFTWWVDDVLMDEQKRTRDKVSPPEATDWNHQISVIRVFDQLIYNTDRNQGNIIITTDWNLRMIDHTRAFRTRTDLLAAKNLRYCDRKLLERMRELDKPALQKALRHYLIGTEINGLLARCRAIVKIFDEAVKEKGEGAVLYNRVVRN